MKWRFTVLAAIMAPASLIGCATGAASGEGAQRNASAGAGALYHGFTMIDPATKKRVNDAWIVVKGDRIAAIGAGTPPRRRYGKRVDRSGHFALPGLIDFHGHITAGPHEVKMVDGAPVVTIESVDNVVEMHARMALAFGVTTVRNPGGDPAANARYDARIASGEWTGPQAFHAGAVIEPPPFGGNAFAYPTSEAAWDAEAARQAALGMRYFKMYTDLSKEELATGVAAAHRHGLKAIAHLNGVSWTDAARAGVDGLEHALPTSPDLLEPGARETYKEFLANAGPSSKYMYRWFELVDFEGPLFSEMLFELSARQIQTNMTFLVQDLVFNIDDLDHVIPPADNRYSHPAALEASLNFLRASAHDWGPADFDRARRAMARVLEFGRRLHEAGVPMAIGTDGAGGGPIFAHELGRHVDAGIPVWEALRMATSGAAEMLGEGDRIGRFKRGMEADFVFLTRDPLADVRAVRDVAYVVANGREWSFGDLTTGPGSAPVPED